MGTANSELTGPDLSAGVELEKLEEGRAFPGHFQGEQVLLVRRGSEVFAVGATCTHYSGPLAGGIVVGDEIRCPWHHACFSLRTGEATRAPALNPIARFLTSLNGDVIRVTAKLQTVVIIGAGAAGGAAAEELRQRGFKGDITLVDADAAAPYDRPNLSKDYLAGNAPEEWIALRSAEFYDDIKVRRIAAEAKTIDTKTRSITLSDHTSLKYDALLIATGATPIRPAIPGVDLTHVHVLRTWDDSRSIVNAATPGKRVLIAGASFIGMETAAALRTRGIAVRVVAPETIPFAKVLGERIGGALKTLHEEHGVEFNLGRTIKAIEAGSVTLDDSARVDADVVVLGIGVRPRTELAESAGIDLDRGVLVNEFMETSAAGVFAAGDIARYPYGPSRSDVRIEHWMVAQNQGKLAARNILGAREAFVQIPFFWTTQYDVTINYVGHAETWTHSRLEGSPEARNCSVAFMDGDRVLAFATIGRDAESLKMERELETWK